MPWRLSRNDQVVCTGPCSTSKYAGFVPCPVNHKTAPFNGVDTHDGTPFFRCDTCDWIRPDPDGENKYDTAGMIVCPECCNGENNDTYNGPCEEGCNRRNAGAEYRPIPDDIRGALTRKHGRAGPPNTYACAKCFHEMCERYRRELAQEIRAEEEYAAWRARNAQYPPGTCGICRNIRNLQIIDNDAGVYVCIECHPQWAADQLAHTEPTDQSPPAGWYPDPDDSENYLRWWSGTEWVGLPTLPEHILNQ